LLGGAVGDALGADIEFMWLNEIREEYGSEGLKDYASEQGVFTDDTQLTLFTAEGLLDSVKNGSDELSNIHRAYLRWYATQHGKPSALSLPSHDGLITMSGMHRRRAPGTTCLSALKATWKLGEFAVNNSSGCGGVMRSAPIGLFAPQLGDSDAAIFALADEAAALTHGHPSGHLPAGFLAVMVAALLRGKGPGGAILCASDQLRQYDDFDETMGAVEAAIALAGEGRPTPELLEDQLGGGWTGESALSIAIACALTANSFEQGVLMAVNHSGDSDSTGAITGNLLGALFGVNGIPAHWLKRLELRHTVDGIAVKLDTATTAKAIVE
jgi:ADP-ribosylglycohydrolase